MSRVQVAKTLGSTLTETLVMSISSWYVIFLSLPPPVPLPSLLFFPLFLPLPSHLFNVDSNPCVYIEYSFVKSERVSLSLSRTWNIGNIFWRMLYHFAFGHLVKSQSPKICKQSNEISESLEAIDLAYAYSLRWYLRVGSNQNSPSTR